MLFTPVCIEDGRIAPRFHLVFFLWSLVSLVLCCYFYIAKGQGVVALLVAVVDLACPPPPRGAGVMHNNVIGWGLIARSLQALLGCRSRHEHARPVRFILISLCLPPPLLQFTWSWQRADKALAS